MPTARLRHVLLITGAACLGATVPSSSSAAPPQLTGANPLGVQRGTPTDVVFNGTNLSGNPRVLAPFAFRAEAGQGSDGSSFKLKLTADPSVHVGVYPVRVQTDDGLSNLFLFSVGQFAQVAEKEENSQFEAAQVVETPVVVEGQSAGNDVDYFKFRGKKGRRIVIDAQCARIGSGVDPTVRLTTAARAYIGSADDSPGLLTDARLFATLPEDGDYVVELSDSRYQGGGRPVYRLLIADVPAPEEVYPIGGRAGETVGFELRGGTLAGTRIVAATVAPFPGLAAGPFSATSCLLGLDGPSVDVESLGDLVVSDLPELREPADAASAPARGAVPVAFNGRIDPEGDEDRFTLAVTPGQKLRIEVDAAESGSALDGVLKILDPKGAVLATADDTATPTGAKVANKAVTVTSPDPSLDFTVPEGLTEVTLALKDLEGRGGVGFPYRITVVPVSAGFELVANESQVSVPKGGTAAVGVTLVRKGYAGPITLKVLNPPAGLTSRPGTVAEGQLLGGLTVSAAPDAAFPATALNIVGEGKGPDGAVVRQATFTTVFAKQADLPTRTLTQRGVAAAPALAPPVAFDTPAEAIEVAHGSSASVALKATRPAGSDGVLTITPLPLPPGLAVAAAKFEEKATDATVGVTPAVEHPLGLVSVVLVAKGKVAGSDRSLTLPALTFDVVRPATVELKSPTLELKAGATAEVAGKVVRRGGFKDPVTVKLNNLPAGLKAEPVTIAADASDFTLKVVAEEKAAAASASAAVAPVYQINKKDYPAPTAPLAVKVVAAK